MKFILFALVLLFAGPAPADVHTRLEVLRARAAARVIVLPTENPVVTVQLRVKAGLCTRDVTITRQGDRTIAVNYAPKNCRKISE